MMPLWATDGNVSVKAFAHRLNYPLLLDYASMYQEEKAEQFSVVHFVHNWLNNHQSVQVQETRAIM